MIWESTEIFVSCGARNETRQYSSYIREWHSLMPINPPFKKNLLGREKAPHQLSKWILEPQDEACWKGSKITLPKCNEQVIDWTLLVGTSNFTNQVVCKTVYGYVLLKKKKKYSSGNCHASIVCKYFISISTFQSCFSFLNDSQISQSRSGRIISTCQQSAFILLGDKCGRKCVNLSQDFFNLPSLQTCFLWMPASLYIAAFSISVPFQASSVYKNLT